MAGENTRQANILEVQMTKHFLPELFGRRGAVGPFGSLHREVDRVFEDFGRGWPWGNGGGRDLKMNVAETEKDIEVTADVPGMEPKDIKVELREGVLTIKGEKQAEKDDKGKDYHLVERSYGMFERSVMLPSEVDADKVAASFDKGVLTVKLPKKPGAAENIRKIEVKAA
jgi:HSP20 family protein